MYDSININSQQYYSQDKIVVNISDSFVCPSNKTGNGSGESRLYLSSTNSIPFFLFSSYEKIIYKNKEYKKCPHNCYLIKENLIDYLNAAEDYYKKPSYQHRKNISLLFSERQREVFSINSDLLEFSVFLQNGDLDLNRFYIGCIDYAWSLIRTLSIPFLTSLQITKFSSPTNYNDVVYTFELLFHSDAQQSIQTTKQIENSIQNSLIQDTSINTTEKISLVKARRGQGKFKANVLMNMPKCPFTNISDSFLLIASHIKPWALCDDNFERLDGFNGLALTPTYDKLFDLGYISFSNFGELLISPLLDENTIYSLNLVNGHTYDIYNIAGRRNKYLEFHRNNIFKK